MVHQCNLCGCDRYKIMLTLDHKNVVACKDCGLVTYWPMPTKPELLKMYSESYFDQPYFHDTKTKKNSFRHRYFRETVNRLADYRGGKILEIGPGLGDFMQLCRQKSLNIEAVDISPVVVDRLKKDFGYHVYQGALEELSLPDKSYKAVVAFDVIEHCVDPAGWLQKIYRLLEDDGLLILSTHNVDNLLYVLGHMFYALGIKGHAQRLYPGYHLYYFTLANLRRYITESGFKIISLTQENYSVENATSSRIVQLALKFVYLLHNIFNKKTNQYVVTVKNNR